MTAHTALCDPAPWPHTTVRRRPGTPGLARTCGARTRTRARLHVGAAPGRPQPAARPGALRRVPPPSPACAPAQPRGAPAPPALREEVFSRPRSPPSRRPGTERRPPGRRVWRGGSARPCRCARVGVLRAQPGEAAVPGPSDWSAGSPGLAPPARPPWPRSRRRARRSPGPRPRPGGGAGRAQRPRRAVAPAPPRLFLRDQEAHNKICLSVDVRDVAPPPWPEPRLVGVRGGGRPGATIGGSHRHSGVPRAGPPSGRVAHACARPARLPVPAEPGPERSGTMFRRKLTALDYHNPAGFNCRGERARPRPRPARPPTSGPP